MVYETLYDDFLKDIPESREFCEEQSRVMKLDGEGEHVLFAFAVVPYILNVYENGLNDTARKIAAFMERMAESTNHLISEVLEFSVLESLVENHRLIKDWWPYFGSATRESIHLVARYVG